MITDRQTNRQTDICDCRVTFVTEKSCRKIFRNLSQYPDQLPENQDPDLYLEKANLDPIPQKMKNLSLFVQVQNLNPSQDLGVKPWLLTWILMIKMSKDKGKDLIQEKAEISRRPIPAAGLSLVKVNFK